MPHRPSVLLVDDDPLVRDLLTALFGTHTEFRIAGVAADGIEAAMLCADVDPDVVVLDFFMPRWDGARAAEFIRKNCPRTQILAFSAVLMDAPPWCDRFLVKNEIQRLVPIVREMTQAVTAA